METFLDDKVITESIDQLLHLARLSLYKINVLNEVEIAIHDIQHYLLIEKPGDPESYLMAFKTAVARLADNTHPCMPDYARVLEYAASLLVIETP